MKNTDQFKNNTSSRTTSRFSLKYYCINEYEWYQEENWILWVERVFTSRLAAGWRAVSVVPCRGQLCRKSLLIHISKALYSSLQCNTLFAQARIRAVQVSGFHCEERGALDMSMSLPKHQAKHATGRQPLQYIRENTKVTFTHESSTHLYHNKEGSLRSKNCSKMTLHMKNITCLFPILLLTETAKGTQIFPLQYTTWSFCLVDASQVWMPRIPHYLVPHPSSGSWCSLFGAA